MNNNLANHSKRLADLVLAIIWLLVILWLVYRWSYPPQLPALPSSDQMTAPLVSTDSLDRVEPMPAIDALESYRELITRPLFYPNRRPQTASVSESAPIQREIIDDLILIGVMHVENVTRVLVRDERSGRVSRITLGDSLAGWQLKSAGAEHIVMVQKDNERVLNLVRNQRQPRAIPSADDAAAEAEEAFVEPDENNNDQGDLSEAG